MLMTFLLANAHYQRVSVNRCRLPWLPFGRNVQLLSGEGTEAVFGEEGRAVLLDEAFDGLTPPPGLSVGGALQHQGPETSSVCSRCQCFGRTFSVSLKEDVLRELFVDFDTNLDRLLMRTPCLVSVSLESIWMPNSLSTNITKEMAPESGFMYSRKESFTTSQLDTNTTQSKV